MRTNRRSSLNALMPAAGLGPAIVRGGAVFAAAVCGGCLYTSIPAQAGPSAKYRGRLLLKLRSRPTINPLTSNRPKPCRTPPARKAPAEIHS